MFDLTHLLLGFFLSGDSLPITAGLAVVLSLIPVALELRKLRVGRS